MAKKSGDDLKKKFATSKEPLPMPLQDAMATAEYAEGGQVPSFVDEFLAEPMSGASPEQARQAGQAVIGAVESGPSTRKAPMEGIEPEMDPISEIAGMVGGEKLGVKAVTEGERLLARKAIPEAFERHFPAGAPQQASRATAEDIARLEGVRARNYEAPYRAPETPEAEKGPNYIQMQEELQARKAREAGFAKREAEYKAQQAARSGEEGATQPGVEFEHPSQFIDVQKAPKPASVSDEQRFNELGSILQERQLTPAEFSEYNYLFDRLNEPAAQELKEAARARGAAPQSVGQFRELPDNRIPEGLTYRFNESPNDLYPHEIVDSQGNLAGVGATKEEAIREVHRRAQQRLSRESAQTPIRSQYNIPEVQDALANATSREDKLLTLENDGVAYEALMNNFPELRGREDWAERVLKDIYKEPKELGKFEGTVTSINQSSGRKLSKDAKSTLDEVYDKRLNFFDHPEHQFDRSFVAKDSNGDVIGHLGIGEEEGMHMESGDSHSYGHTPDHTSSIKVDPDYQGQGVASSLYHRALNKLGVIRSSTEQLPGGEGLWAKFERDYPMNVSQARDEKTLEPLNYKVWQKDVDPVAKKAERKLEAQIDAAREAHIKAKEAVRSQVNADSSTDPRIIDLSDKAREARRNNQLTWNSLESWAEARATSSGAPTANEIYGQFLRGEPVDPEFRQMAQAYQKSFDKYEKATNAYSAAQKNWKPDPKAKKVAEAKAKTAKAKLDRLIKQYKDSVRKSHHEYYADGGIVDNEDHARQHIFGDAAVPAYVSSFLAGGNALAGQDSEVPPEVASFLAPEAEEARYGTPIETGKAILEAFGKGLAGPLSTGAEVGLGVQPEAIAARERQLGGGATAAEAAGLIAPAILSGGESLLAKAVPFTQHGVLEAIGKKVGLTAGESLASRIGTEAARGAIDNALLSAGSEVSKLILNDPDQSAQTALASIGLSGALGAGAGAALGSVSKLWRTAVSDKAGQVVEDFKGRMNDHLNNLNDHDVLGHEVQELYNSIIQPHDEVYGTKGLKAQEIAKLMPELNHGMLNQVAEIGAKLEGTLGKLSRDPNYEEFSGMVDQFKAAVDTNDPVSMFNTTQELKQALQERAFEYDKRGQIPPVAERKFIGIAKELQHDLKEALEDSKVWGFAADRQKSINEAFSEFLPKLKQFRKTFMYEPEKGVFEINPQKIQTYLNQLGKPAAEIKQSAMQDFIDAATKYREAINTTHGNLGLEHAAEPTSMNAIMASLKEKTLGAQIADALLERGMSRGAGEAVGAGLGVAAGHRAGIPGAGFLGAMLGSSALGHLFESTLPTITKAMVANPVSSAGLRAASDFVVATAKGESMLNKAAKGLFRIGSKEAGNQYAVSEAERAKLDKVLRAIQMDPNALINKENHIQKYLPNQATALDLTTGNAVNFLNGLRASQDRPAPLDGKPVLSTTQKSEYDNALNIAQQPLIIFDKIAKGTITSKDMMVLGQIYPQLYARMREKVQSELVDAVNRKEIIPYKTRLGLSVFLGTALDSTMTPAAIQATQPAPQQQPPQGAPQAPQKGSKSAPALQKMGQMYQTPAQSREQHAGKR